MQYGSLGAQIRHFRRLRDMTQEELALQAGYQTKASIAKIEKNQATVPEDRLQKIANALRVDVPTLQGKDPNESLAEYGYNNTSATAHEVCSLLTDAIEIIKANAVYNSGLAEKFNQLNPTNQSAVMTMVDALLAQQK